MEFLKYLGCVFLGFSSGIVISGAIFAFIAVIGIVPRLAQKTRTEKQIKLYEEAIIFGGIFGAIEISFNFHLPIGRTLAALYSLAVGIFIGCLAVSLAEVLNVIPVLTRRGRIQKGINFFIYAIAFGKLIGSMLYYFVSGFYTL